MMDGHGPTLADGHTLRLLHRSPIVRVMESLNVFASAVFVYSSICSESSKTHIKNIDSASAGNRKRRSSAVRTTASVSLSKSFTPPGHQDLSRSSKWKKVEKICMHPRIRAQRMTSPGSFPDGKNAVTLRRDAAAHDIFVRRTRYGTAGLIAGKPEDGRSDDHVA